MKFANFLIKSALLLSMICLPLSAVALSFVGTHDDDFIAARRAYEKKDGSALSAIFQQLQDDHYVLAPYADYWLILLQLGQADTIATDQAVPQFLEKYSDYLFADRVRGEWLKSLAKRQEWASFYAEYPNFKRDDVAVSCYAADGRYLLSNTHVSDTQSDSLTKNTDDQYPSEFAAAKSLWFVATEQPTNCNQLFDHLQQAGVLTDADIWARFRLALQAGKINLANGIIARLTSVGSVANAKLLDRVNDNPPLALSKKIISTRTRYGRELNLFALDKLAQASAIQALTAYPLLMDSFTKDYQAVFYGRLAYFSAKRLEPDALIWYKKSLSLSEAPITGKPIFDKEQAAWFVRIALRQNDWPSVLTAINLMATDQQQEAAWRYWKARAYKQTGQGVEANKLFATLSTERHYYGWLAQDEIGDAMSNPPNFYKASDSEIDAISDMPAILRSEAFQRLEMRWDAKAEWAWATRNFDDKQMLAAAEYANRKQWHDLAITTADKTTSLHDYELRYPTPYRNLIKVSANNQGVDEAWVYGITRQESRFMHYAKSGVGAAGLMQLMPATAKWIAKRAGWDNYNSSMIHDLDTNIQLGTYYLRYTLDLMGGKPLIATAAYNAGPSRAKKWLANTPLEGAIYAESIPFAETRTYVQKVMANAHLYTTRLGLKTISLKQRLGVVPANGSLLNTPAIEATPSVDSIEVPNSL
ncbi:MAG: lytic transglycosylase domain-containing protein [Methylophilaceae bacterium]|nr:lytic transglycosylase domain-containing protein [Methylophilaceae bacterium]